MSYEAAADRSSSLGSLSSSHLDKLSLVADDDGDEEQDDDDDDGAEGGCGEETEEPLTMLRTRSSLAEEHETAAAASASALLRTPLSRVNKLSVPPHSPGSPHLSPLSLTRSHSLPAVSNKQSYAAASAAAEKSSFDYRVDDLRSFIGAYHRWKTWQNRPPGLCL